MKKIEDSERLDAIEGDLWEIKALMERTTNNFSLIAEQVMKDIEKIKKKQNEK